MTKQERIESLKMKVTNQEDRITELRSNHTMDEHIRNSQIDDAQRKLTELKSELNKWE